MITSTGPDTRPGTAATAAVRLESVSRTYGRGANAVAALRDVTVTVPAGSFTAVMGPSGSGKSTFLHCAAGLDRPTSGTTWLGDTELSRLDENALTRLRRLRIGFVFQAFNLVPSLTVAQNVALPFRLAGTRVDRARLREVLARVGLADRARHRPAELSGGQQQRVAVARALVTRPQVVFADEPTGALDLRSGGEVLALLRDTIDRVGTVDTVGTVGTVGHSVVMVTHDPRAAAFADTVLFLADGRIVDTMSGPTADRVADRMTSLGAWA